MTSSITLARLRKESTAAERIPYAAQVAEHVVRTLAGDYVQVFRVGGASFEAQDDVDVNSWHERLNVLWRNIASPNVAVWTHVIRRREEIYPQGEFADAFSATLNARYRERLAGERLMVNELYLALVYRPTVGAATGWTAKLLTRGARGTAELSVDSLDACEKLRQTVKASLERYEAESLGTYSARGRRYSRLLEFLALLINGESQPIPLPRSPVNQVLATTRVSCGTETLEYRTPTQTRLSAMLGIKEYPTPTVVGMFDALLSAPFPLVLTQSFTFLSKAASQGLLVRQNARLLNSGDFAVSQADELQEALDALTSNEFAMGDHHLSLQVLGDPFDGVRDGEDVRRFKILNDRVGLARALLADTGMTVAREDLALEAAFWAQLPGQFALRPRKAPITTRNFAAMAPLHNYPAGRVSGNHWGPALTLLTTSARSPFYFSLHASDPRDPDGGSRKDTGHTLLVGPTGSGKTVLVGFLIAMLQKHGATQVVIDKDRGLEILVRALGGAYLPLKNGEPTGFNPLALSAESANVEFLKTWLRLLVQIGRPAAARGLAVREESDLDQALRGTLALEPAARRLSRLIEFLDPTDPEGMHARLSRWCAVTQGEYAWVFDHAEDSVVPHLTRQSIIGFDVTDFLDHEVVRAPVTLYLFHLIRRLLGRRLVCWMDEFWRLLADPAFESFAKDGPKTWRKLDGVMCLATQSPSDVLQSPISRTIIEQTATQIFFPNVQATAQDYVEGFGLSEREFKLIQELEPGSRRFLVRQSHHSVVCQLDLKGFDAELAIISGRASSVARMHQLMAEHGPDPALWLPAFCAPFNI
jgi:type IV secretion system protein VirB4